VTVSKGNKRILGFGSHLVVQGAAFTASTPVFDVAMTDGPVSFEDMILSGVPAIDFAGATAQTLVLKHVYMKNIGAKVAGYAYVTDSATPGPLFLEDVAGGPWSFSGNQQIWARQFDVEENYNPVKISNQGARLWILGLKTEQPTTVIATSEGGSTELLGGLLYPLAGTTLPAFTVNGGKSSMTYAVSAYGAAANYTNQIQITGGGKTMTVQQANLLARGRGSLLPFFSTIGAGF
jgi:hypothetical protein